MFSDRIFSEEISIHALVKRATISLRFVGFAVAISIHALVKRATSFYSSFGLTAYISIHALVKRATKNDPTAITPLEFQSTPS